MGIVRHASFNRPHRAAHSSPRSGHDPFGRLARRPRPATRARDLLAMASRRELTLAGILPYLVRDDGGWRITYQGVTLRSVFQPVVSITHKRVIGYEALLRATDSAGRAIKPDELFARAHSSGAALAFERLARCVHFANFAEQSTDNGWLFVNALPRLFRTGWPYRAFIDELCEHFAMPPQRVVMEMIEQPATDERLFEKTVETLRERGLLIAIDDFGTGFSNFDRIWRVRPDIVKLDRSLVARFATPGADQQFATQLVTMLHRAGAMVLGEGVEKEAELLPLMDADVDFVQGFWLGRPLAALSEASALVPERVESMWQSYRAHTGAAPGSPLLFAHFEETVRAGAHLFKTSAKLAEAAAHTLSTPFARRVFVVDALGDQREPSIAAHADPPPERLAPLFPDTLSNWSRRSYFKRAMSTPGRVAIMGPHYSLTEGKDTYTAAITVDTDSGVAVFCVDFVLDASPPGAGGG
jgi:EAL domain-containing protein (putative c-di-GMP-specific phosphodiesterase class I)